MGVMRMRIGMMVTMVMVMMVTMSVIMIMVTVIMRMKAGADALDMVMVAHLRQAHFLLEAQHLRAIFAQAAVHVGVTCENLANALGEGLDDERVVVEIGGLDELNSGKKARRPVH